MMMTTDRLTHKEIEQVVNRIQYKDFQIRFFHETPTNSSGVQVSGMFPERESFRRFMETKKMDWRARYQSEMESRYETLGNPRRYIPAEEKYRPVRSALDDVKYVPVQTYQPFHDEHIRNPETVVRSVFSFCRMLEDHESFENFYVDGVRVFDPHKHDGLMMAGGLIRMEL